MLTHLPPPHPVLCVHVASQRPEGHRHRGQSLFWFPSQRPHLICTPNPLTCPVFSLLPAISNFLMYLRCTSLGFFFFWPIVCLPPKGPKSLLCSLLHPQLQAQRLAHSRCYLNE